MSKPILVVTCPNGKQCTPVLPLVQDHFQLRLAAHFDASAAKLRLTYPEAEILTTDLQSLTRCQSLVKGATSVYHVGPSFHSREKEMGVNMVDAATAESQRPGNMFKHFVFSSVLGTQHRMLLQHDMKSYIEERVFLSPLNWTILQPTNFMDAYPVALLKSMEKPVLEPWWNPSVPNSLITLRDLAEAAAKVLKEGEKHHLAQYPLCSTMPKSDHDTAMVIGKAIGKEVECRGPSFEKGVDMVLHFLFSGKADEVSGSTGSDVQGGGNAKDFELANEGDLRGDLTRDEAERLILFYNRRGLRGSPNVLRWLLGREPTSVEEWVKTQL